MFIMQYIINSVFAIICKQECRASNIYKFKTKCCGQTLVLNMRTVQWLGLVQPGDDELASGD
jgi:hypothetical protein